MSVVVLRVVTSCGLAGRYRCFRPEEGGCVFLRNSEIYLSIHTELLRLQLCPFRSIIIIIIIIIALTPSKPNHWEEVSVLFRVADMKDTEHFTFTVVFVALPSSSSSPFFLPPAPLFIFSFPSLSFFHTLPWPAQPCIRDRVGLVVLCSNRFSIFRSYTDTNYCAVPYVKGVFILGLFDYTSWKSNVKDQWLYSCFVFERTHFDFRQVIPTEML